MKLFANLFLTVPLYLPPVFTGAMGESHSQDRKRKRENEQQNKQATNRSYSKLTELYIFKELPSSPSY